MPAPARVLDIGSAMTFFPTYLASLGYEVSATDIDNQWVTCGQKLWGELASKGELFDSSTLERLSYRQEDASKLTFDDATFDVVTSISVLEHLDDQSIQASICEAERVLKPGGIFVCTLDVLMDGEGRNHHDPLDQERFSQILSHFEKYFTWEAIQYPQAPADVLSNKNAAVVAATETPALLPLCKDKDSKSWEAVRTKLWQQKKHLRNVRDFAVNGHLPESLTWTAYGMVMKRRSR